MEQTYYLIIMGALIIEYVLSTLSSILNMNSITEEVPDGFQDYYDRTAIEEFAGKVNFPIGRIDVMDGSRRSAHSNAYFSGFGKSRRIALFDTLLDKHTTEEIVSVVAHEVGHYKKKHVITGTVLGILETGLMLYIFNYFMSDQALFDVFGVKEVSVYCGLVLFGPCRRE